MSLYLVTGGAGFIGSNLVDELVKREERVRVLDNFSTGRQVNLDPFMDKIELVEGDIRSAHIVREAMQGVDYVLHHAALPSVPRSVRDPLTTNEVNVTGTLNLLDAARDAHVKRFVFASSSSIYGNARELPIQENAPKRPLSPYGISKMAAEKYCQIYTYVYGLKTVVLRYFHVFGPRQDGTGHYSAVVPRFIHRMRQGLPPVVFGDGEQTRDFTYVENVVCANMLACETEDHDCVGKVFNIGTGKAHSVRDLVTALSEIMGTDMKHEFELDRQADIKHSQAHIEKAKHGLYYMVVRDFRSGLEKTVHYHESQ
ncbi:SDR family oxidoreductase [bacterium]|nr:SDR family oxidoreductase [bacterium]